MEKLIQQTQQALVNYDLGLITLRELTWQIIGLRVDAHYYDTKCPSNVLTPDVHSRITKCDALESELKSEYEALLDVLVEEIGKIYVSFKKSTEDERGK